MGRFRECLSLDSVLEDIAGGIDTKKALFLGTAKTGRSVATPAYLCGIFSVFRSLKVLREIRREKST